MPVELTVEEREALEQARAQAKRVREWRRYQALLLLGARRSVGEVAATLGCGQSSVYNWVMAWRRDGVAGLAEGPHRGRPRRLAGDGDALLAERLDAGDPQAHGYHATGWTVPLLQTELAQAGVAVSRRTVRRAVHQLHWRWKRPKYVLGRPDPDYERKKGN